ncbi:MAG TPA: hypothetical protein VD838_18600 [Anaeromyxobacteraceae bacterium]|nr:hypothetical protein [Anaeromyxobacteraceae bacterium]
MKPVVIALSGVLLSACVVYEPYQPAPTHAERARARVLSEREAIRAAEDICRERGLDVDRVHHAELDPEGRWRVELRGPTGDRAKLLLDARTGRLLRGRFRDGDGSGAANGSDEPPPPPPPEQP